MLKRYFTYLAIPIFFLPAWLYRWSLKSTCWLYLPLIYLVSKPREEPDGPALLLTTLREEKLESFRQALALIVIVSTAITTYSKVHGAALHNAPIPLYLWAFDLINMAPWQWFSLLSAAITGVLYFYSDRAHIAWKVRQERYNDPRTDPYPHHIHNLHRLTRFRNVSTMFFLLLAAGYAILAMLPMDPWELPEWLFLAKVLYGPYLP